jgi:hypothetical protein
VSAAPATLDPTLIPGRALFWDAGELQLLEKGRVRKIDTPYFVRERSSGLSPDGRIVAVLGGEGPGEAHIWELARDGTQRLVKMPVTLATYDALAWSPEATRAQWGRFGGDEIWIVGLDGARHRATFANDAVYSASWRTDQELTVVSAPRPSAAQTNGWPIAGATLWTWRPPHEPVRLAGPVTLASVPRWSEDGRTLASIEETPAGRAVVLRAEVDRTVLSERDLATGPDGCSRAVEFMGLSWSPDGLTLAVLGRGSDYFAAFVDVRSAGPAKIFAAPVGPATCYIPGQVEWHGAVAVVPLHGPDCGPSASGRENAFALVDPKTGSVIRYVPISRKGFQTVSGDWAVAVSSLDERGTEFISLEPQGPRVKVPLWRLVDYRSVP